MLTSESLLEAVNRVQLSAAAIALLANNRRTLALSTSPFNSAPTITAARFRPLRVGFYVDNSLLLKTVGLRISGISSTVWDEVV